MYFKVNFSKDLIFLTTIDTSDTIYERKESEKLYLGTKCSAKHTNTFTINYI